MPKVSIIVPVYNVERYVKRCIVSLQQQTFSDIEVIVVDDCSPDDSMSIVSELSQNDERIRTLYHEKNKGLMMARRTGYMAAKGDYVSFCDSDDYLPTNAIELLYNEAIKTGAEIVSGDMTYIMADGTYKAWRSTLKYGNDQKSALKSLLLRELRHNLCSKLFKRSLLQDHNYQTFEHFTNGEDGCLFYQLIHNTNMIVQIGECVYYYLQNEESSSNVRFNDNALRSICVVNRIRHEVTCIYPELDELRHQYITRFLYSLFSQGYSYSTNLDTFITEQGLDRYKILKGSGFSISEIIKLWIKRHILGPINYIRYQNK